MYLKLCSKDDVPPGGMKQFDLRDREFLVVNLGGKYYCLDGRCTHAGAPLAEGVLEGDILTCPWHYSRFKITTGEVERGPAMSTLNIYRSKMDNGQLFVDLELDES